MQQDWYEIHVKGHLSEDWSDWFDGLTVINLEGGEARLSGPIPDQAALHGVLARLHTLNLTLRGLRWIGPAGDERCSSESLFHEHDRQRHRNAGSFGNCLDRMDS